MNVLSFLLCIGVIVLVIWMICKTKKKEDMGCDFDCENCPFPPCTKEEIENMKKRMKN